MTEWKEYKLGEIVTFQRGHDLPKDKMIDGSVPVAGSNGIIGFHNQFTKEGPGVTIGRSGNIGIPHYYPNAYWAHNTVLYIIDFNGNDAKFMYYLLKTFDFTQLNTGSAVPSLNRNHIHELPVSIPDVPTQRRISAILSSLDDKIDLLHRENATLEQMAETLFRQWFVVEAKEEWEERMLGEVVKTTSGGTPSRKHSEYYENGTINWVKSKELDGSFISSTEELITENAVANSSAKMLPEKSVLIAMYGATVGEYGILSKPMTCNQAVCALIPNENYPYTYLFVWTALMKEDFINLASGAAQQNISQDLIKQQIVCSDLDRIKQYDEMVKGFFEKMENNQKQIQTLIQTRDGLLPRLMGGEVKI